MVSRVLSPHTQISSCKCLSKWLGGLHETRADTCGTVRFISLVSGTRLSSLPRNRVPTNLSGSMTNQINQMKYSHSYPFCCSVGEVYQANYEHWRLLNTTLSSVTLVIMPKHRKDFQCSRYTSTRLVHLVIAICSYLIFTPCLKTSMTYSKDHMESFLRQSLKHSSVLVSLTIIIMRRNKTSPCLASHQNAERKTPGSFRLLSILWSITFRRLKKAVILIYSIQLGLVLATRQQYYLWVYNSRSPHSHDARIIRTLCWNKRIYFLFSFFSSLLLSSLHLPFLHSIHKNTLFLYTTSNHTILHTILHTIRTKPSKPRAWRTQLPHL